MKDSKMPPVIQAVGLACVPVDDMPPGNPLARKPVAGAIVTLVARDDGHRDAIATCVSDARAFEWPLPVLIDRALVPGVPTIITKADRDILVLDAASRRFFVEGKIAALGRGEGLVDPVAMFGADLDEAALCRRLGVPANLVPDQDIARWWNREAPTAVEGVALTAAVARLVLWAHGTATRSALPDAFFETLLPLRERLFDVEAEHPAMKAMLSSRPFHRAASFASDYRTYRAQRDAGDADTRWVTFEDGLSHV